MMGRRAVSSKQQSCWVGNRSRKHTRMLPAGFQSFNKLDFNAAMDAAGLHTKDNIIPDGKLHRFTVESDKPGSKNGWYVIYDDSLPAGAFGCWKRQVSVIWCAKSDRKMTAVERAEFTRRMNEVRHARAVEEQARRLEARNRAIAIWQAASPASDAHCYLVKKGIRNHGLRLHNGTLVIPMRDSAGKLHSLQFINGYGNKRFLSGGRIQGCYYSIGVPAETICIAEGFATGASIYEATGHAVAVAFNCGNLLSVARTLRAKFPAIEIILCADNDENTLGNPGLTKAREAAAAVGALFAMPPCEGDFNDLLIGRAAR